MLFAMASHTENDPPTDTDPDPKRNGGASAGFKRTLDDSEKCFFLGHVSPTTSSRPHSRSDFDEMKSTSSALGPDNQRPCENHTQSVDHNLTALKNMSLGSYLYSELTRGYVMEYEEAKFSEKRRRVYTFIKIPRELENFMTYGFFQCVDAFLYIFTFLPLRFLAALAKLCIKGCMSPCWSGPGRVLDAAQICDLLKGVILISCCMALDYVDVSMMYHIIRGQTIIKLYIFFNMLEVFDRLMSSFGQDILDTLFWTATERRGKKREHFGMIPHLALAVLYVFLHAILVLFQATTLNVAFNSHNKALLTIMMSNNFVELKACCFKKFEKNNLFQMSCSDVRERFHFVVLLSIVSIRNLTEFSWNMEHMWVLVPDILMVMVAELIVDWVKHAFITKFNELPAEVYREYTVSIAYDMANSRQKKAFSDHLDLVSRRMGFIPLPLAVLLVRVVSQSMKFKSLYSCSLLFIFYLCLVTFKVLNSIVLLGKACQYIQESKDKASAAATPATLSKELGRSQSMSDIPVELSQLQRKTTTTTTTSAHANEVETISAGIKRSQSFSGKPHVDPTAPEETSGSASTTASSSGATTTTPEHCLPPLLSNSNVSLASVSFNEEYIKDKEALEKETRLQRGSEGTEVKHRLKDDQTKTSAGKRPQKPLSEIDRYTLVGNSIM